MELVRFISFGLVIRETDSLDGWTTLELAINFFRIVCLTVLVAIYVIFSSRRKPPVVRFHVDEAAPLLATALSNGHSNGRAYGAARPSPAVRTVSSMERASVRSQLEVPEESDEDQPGWTRPDKLPSRGWWEYLKGYSVFFPYLWPTENKRLQMTVLACFTLVVLQRAVNVLVPFQIGVITDDLSGENGPVHIPWAGIITYICLRSLQGSNSLIGAIRSYLWIPVSQYAYRELTIASFEHVHNLSLDFHISKKTGEVLSALGKGNSINNFLDQITFQVVPMIVDLVVAVGYFLIAFDAYFALVVMVMTFWYIYITIRLARWRANARRRMVNLDRYQDGVK
jgi:ATP-binding cassette, subfamily B, vacuolar membrane transporter HMT1/ACLQ